MIDVADEWRCKNVQVLLTQKTCSEGEVRLLGLETDRVVFVISLAGQ